MTERRTRRRVPSTRMRILGWYVALLAVAIVPALLIQRSFMVDEVVSQADEALDQEVGELRQLAGGVDPGTGELFAGNVAAIFDTYLDRNVPLSDEAVITIIGGVPYKSDVSGAAFQGTELLEHWSSLQVPERGQIETDLGPVRYLAVPLASGENVGGVFVVAINLGQQLAGVDGVMRVGGLVLGSILLISSVVAWIAAGEVLRPLHTLSETARSISESDLSARIPVEGDDEIAVLAGTFNEMLDRLEEAFATQRRFVDDASHELRTPITVIRGQLELLGDDPEERKATIQLVTGELDRMSRIVEDLLVLAKAEQPDFIQTHPIDLAEFVDELSVKASALSSRPVPVAATDHAVVVGDRQRLTQAVMNLARNAVEHTPKSAKLSIGAGVNGSSTRLWISDTGPGIPDADRRRLFDRFARGSAGRRSTGGAGLGLPIVKTIAEGHGGSVEVESGSGGSTFTIVIPTGGPGDVEES
ncbi:MAG: sensor histidine kinase [Acidimicrobiia bacterium]